VLKGVDAVDMAWN